MNERRKENTPKLIITNIHRVIIIKQNRLYKEILKSTSIIPDSNGYLK